MFGRINGLLLVCLLIGSACTTARANELVNRLPHNGNALLFIDVTSLLDSPLAKAEGWQSKMMSGYADRPLAISPAAKQVAMTAFLHPASLGAVWQAAVVEMPSAPRLEPILQKQGGYLDNIGGKPAAWTPRDIFHVEIDSHTLGILRPGDRQALLRWTSGQAAQPMSAYLTAALSNRGNAQVVFALDLKDSIGLGAVNYAYSMGMLPSLEKIETGRNQLLAAIASVKGLTLKMTVDKEINSQLTIDFNQDVDALGGEAKAFVIDVLNATDLYDPQVQNWEFTASGKAIVGKGVSSQGAIGRLVALLSPGDLDAQDAANEASPPKAAATEAPAASPGNPPPAASPAAASQAYYRAITKTLDQMSAKSSPTQSATWLHTQAKMIQSLPIVGVDPVLTEWGDQVAGAFSRAAQTLAIGQQNAQAAAQGVSSPTAYANSTETGYGNADTPESRAAFRNAQQQRRQAAQQQRTAAGDQALSILNDAIATRGKIRTLMVQKYNVEF